MTAMEQNPEAPLRVRDAAQLAWDDSADLLVVGFGGAGVCAAIEAASRGVSVLALDRFQGGGATARSGGVVYAGGGTPQQAEAGVEDSVDAMYDYLRLEVGEAVSAETLRGFCQDSRANLANALNKLGTPSRVALPHRAWPNALPRNSIHRWATWWATRCAFRIDCSRGPPSS